MSSSGTTSKVLAALLPPNPKVVPTVTNTVIQPLLHIVKPKKFNKNEKDLLLFLLQLISTFLLQKGHFGTYQLRFLYTISFMEGKALE
jgi:hypothetical protein